MRRLWLGAVLGMLPLAFVIVSVATADRDRGGDFRAKLDGFSEVPAISTAARGKFKAKVDGEAIRFKLTYSGNVTGVQAAHIHFAQEDVNGGIAAFLCGGGGKPACPRFDGEVKGTIVGSDVRGVQGLLFNTTSDLIRVMKSGVTYVNVHSNDFDSGEIRGQIEGEDEDD